MLIEKLLETEFGIIRLVMIAYSNSCVLTITSGPLALGSLSLSVPCLDTPGTSVGTRLLEDDSYTCESIIDMLSAKYAVQIIVNSKLDEFVWAEKTTNKLIIQTLLSLFEETYKSTSK